ncbi:MAG: DoxX family protein [Spirochaetes bacterium]|nr:DoxX family protein [Spirochaetota bacterium]
MAIAGRFIFALPLAVFGLFHFMNAHGMAGMVPVYFGQLRFALVIITGTALIAASISIMTRILLSISMPLLAVMLLMFVGMIHIPGLIGGDRLAMVAVLKDTAIAGAALVIGGTLGRD